MTWNYTIPRKRSRRIWRFATIAALVLVFVGVGRLIRIRRQMAATNPASAFVSRQYSPASAGMDSLPADVYPSKRTAASAAAERLTAAIASVDPDPQRIWVFLNPGQEGEVYAARIREAFPEAWWKTGVETGEEETQPGTVFVRVIEHEEPEVPAHSNPHHVGRGNSYAGSRGSLELRVNGQHGSNTVETRYDSRAWLSDFSAFANSHQHQTWIVAHSRRACTSSSEARAQAESDARDAIADLVRQQVVSLSHRPLNEWQLDHVASRPINAQNLIADRFVQHFHRPYGELWSEAILLDVSPERLSPLINDRLAAIGSQGLRTGRTAGAVAIVLVVILLLYLFLNTITKSYFTGRLRMGAVAAVAVLLLAAGAVMM
ncbi:MAG: hypothetical protein JWN24_1770 [Phycisphaerales bacterium]|nr:hypothetical protein [Phycisphaerales bacterium]